MSWAGSCTFDPAGTGEAASRRSRSDAQSGADPEPNLDVIAAAADRLRSAMPGVRKPNEGEAGEGAESGGAGATAPIDRSSADAAVTEPPRATEPDPAPAAEGGEGTAGMGAAAEDDAGADLDDAGIEPAPSDAGIAGGGAAGMDGSVGAGGVGGEGAAGVGGEAAAGVGGEGAAGIGGEAAAGVGGEGAAGVGGEGAAGVGGEGAAGVGGEGAAGVGGEAAAGVGGAAGAGGAAGGDAPNARDREVLLGLLDVAVAVLQSNPDAQPGDLLSVLASAASADPIVLGRVLQFVDTAQNCDRRSNPCTRVCELAAQRCERCVDDESCRAALRGTCGFEATECP